MPPIAAYLNPEFLNLDDPWSRAKSLGFEMVEIPGSFFEPPAEDEGSSQLAASLDANALSARWHCKPGHNQNFGSDDESLRDANLERMHWELEWVHRMGWDMLILHSGRGETDDERCRAREALNELNEHAQRLGIQLFLENASARFNGDPDEMIATCEAVPGLKITYDTSHAYRSVYCKEGKGSVVDHLNLLKPFVRSFQFNDFDGSANCEVGKGELPWDRLMPIALELECEVWSIELSTIDETVASRDFLCRWLQ